MDLYSGRCYHLSVFVRFFRLYIQYYYNTIQNYRNYTFVHFCLRNSLWSYLNVRVICFIGKTVANLNYVCQYHVSRNGAIFNWWKSASLFSSLRDLSHPAGCVVAALGQVEDGVPDILQLGQLVCCLLNWSSLLSFTR